MPGCVAKLQEEVLTGIGRLVNVCMDPVKGESFKRQILTPGDFPTIGIPEEVVYNAFKAHPVIKSDLQEGIVIPVVFLLQAVIPDDLLSGKPEKELLKQDRVPLIPYYMTNVHLLPLTKIEDVQLITERWSHIISLNALECAQVLLQVSRRNSNLAISTVAPAVEVLGEGQPPCLSAYWSADNGVKIGPYKAERINYVAVCKKSDIHLLHGAKRMQLFGTLTFP